MLLLALVFGFLVTLSVLLVLGAARASEPSHARLAGTPFPFEGAPLEVDPLGNDAAPAPETVGNRVDLPLSSREVGG